MLLVVADDPDPYVRLAPSEGWEQRHAATVEEARSICSTSSPTAVVLACGLDDEARSFVRELRAGRFGDPGVPIAAVVRGEPERADELGIDEAVARPVEEGELRSAIERAVLLGEYKHAVEAFFEVCRERAERDRPARPDAYMTARNHADRCLEELRSHEHAIPFERLINGA